jgi:hypothetical protein
MFDVLESTKRLDDDDTGTTIHDSRSRFELKNPTQSLVPVRNLHALL